MVLDQVVLGNRGFSSRQPRRRERGTERPAHLRSACGFRDGRASAPQSRAHADPATAPASLGTIATRRALAAGRHSQRPPVSLNSERCVRSRRPARRAGCGLSLGRAFCGRSSRKPQPCHRRGAHRLGLSSSPTNLGPLRYPRNAAPKLELGLQCTPQSAALFPSKMTPAWPARLRTLGSSLKPQEHMAPGHSMPPAGPTQTLCALLRTAAYLSSHLSGKLTLPSPLSCKATS